MYSSKSNIGLIGLFLSIIFTLTACGGGGGSSSTPNTPTAKETAFKKIAAFATDGGNPAPTIQDYIDAGVSGVTSATLPELNTVVAGLESDDVDTTQELEALTTQLGINLVPSANAGGNKTTQVNKSVTITGSGNDSDGSIASYKWEKDGVVIAATASFDYTPTTIGTDTLMLTVIDNDGASASDSIVVTVTSTPVSNQTPSANAGTNKSVQVDKNITITGSGTDSDGTISYVWKKGSNVLATTASFTYTPTKVGTDTLTLIVTDDDNASATDTMNVLVTAQPISNQAPTANAGGNKTVQVDKNITIIGSGTDSDGTISFVWKKGAEVLASSASFPYTPIVVGTDTLTLIVTDNDGASATATMNVVVTAVPDTTPPVITLLGSNPASVEQGAAYSDAGASALDNHDGNITAAIVVTGDSVNTNAAIGTKFTITYNVKDAAKNPAVQKSREVTIIAQAPDTTDPVIQRIGSSPLNVIQNSTYTDAGATATDDRDGNISHKIVVAGDTVDTSLPIGSTFIITYNVKDEALNPAIEVTRSVSIIEDPSGDHTIPVLSEADKQSYLAAINNIRAAASTCGNTGNFPAVPAVTWSDKLYKAAYEHSQDMTESGTFAHLGSGTTSDWSGFALSKQSTFGDRLSSYNYNWSWASENIAAGNATLEATMQQWLNSSGHCKNIMSANVTQVGMAKSSNPSTQYRHYWTQNFARPQ